MCVVVAPFGGDVSREDLGLHPSLRILVVLTVLASSSWARRRCSASSATCASGWRVAEATGTVQPMGGTSLSKAPREVDLINAVPAASHAAAEQFDELLKAVLELPDEDHPTSVAALRLWAAALPRLTECDVAMVTASVQLIDWWDQNTPDPALVFGRPAAEQLRRAVQQLNRDQLEHAYTYCRELAATAAARVAELAGDEDYPEESWQAIAEWKDATKAAFGQVLDAVKSFTRYISDRVFDQYVEVFERAARTTPRDVEVRITSQVVMPDGGVVTTDDRVIPPPPPKRRRSWPRRNRGEQ